MTTPLKRLLSGSTAFTPPVVRDPISIAIATAVTGATSGFAFTAVSILAGIGVNMVVSYALSALAPKQGLSSAGAAGLLVNAQDPAAPRQYVYGRMRKGGTITYYESTDDNRYLHTILVIAGHQIDGIDEYYINDEIVTLNGAGFVTSAPWDSKIRIKTHLGTDSQTVDSNLLAESNQITSDFRGRGIAYLYVRFEYDPDVFTDGIPLITVTVRGKRVLDTRTSITGYSANWALCVRDYLVAAYGLDDVSANMNTSYFNVAANISDELVSTPTGNVPRYEMDGVFNSEERVGDVLKKMMIAGAGTLYWGQGQWKIRAGAYTPSVRSINLNDFRSGMVVQTRQSSRDNFNIVRGTFYNELSRYIEMDYPQVRSDTFIAQDNNKEKPFDLEMPFTTNGTRASRIARITLNRSREQITIAADFGMEMFGVEVGDTISFTYDRYGWTNKTFEVSSWKYVSTTEGELKVAVLLREISAAVYGGSVADEQTIISNDSTLPNPLTGLVITGLAQTSTSTVQSDGHLICSAFVTWNAVSSFYLRDYQVQWKENSRTDWNSTFTTNASIELAGLVAGSPTTIRVRARGVNGNFGAFASVSFTPTGDITAPAQPTLISTDSGYGSNTIKWTNPTAFDFKHVEIWVNTTNTTVGATLLGTTDGTAFLHTGLAIGVTRWYFLKSVDFSNNKSAFTVGVSATTVPIPAVDLSGTLDIAQFATTIRPVEVLAALPTTGNFEGRMVYLTTDNKVYRHTGSPSGSAGFTVATDGADIVANSITAGQIAVGAIGADQIAANAIIASKLAVADFTNLVPDNQLQDALVWGNPTRFTLYPTTLAPESGLSKGEIRYTGAFSISFQTCLGLEFSVKAGQELWFQYAIAKSGGTTYRAHGQVLFYNKDGTIVATTNLGPTTTDRTNGVPIFVDGAITVPANATRAAWRWVVNTDVTDAAVRFYIPTIRLKNTGELIVDGAIKTNLLDANAVTADKMAANSITAANAALGDASVETLKIKGRAVTIPVRAQTGGNIRISSAVTWTTVLSAVIAREGYATEIRWSVGLAGFGNSVARLAIFRGSTMLNEVAQAIGLNGRAVVASWSFIDWDTGLGNTIYTLRVMRGDNSPYDYDVQVGVRNITLTQFKR